MNESKMFTRLPIAPRVAYQDTKNNSGIVVDGTPYTQGTELSCPYCGSCYLHVMRVWTEIDPDADEAEQIHGTTRVLVNKTGYRRAALAIKIDCECCRSSMVLSLQQDKGVTRLHTRADGNATLGDE